MELRSSPIAPFIFIDVEALERSIKQEHEEYEAQCRKWKEEEKAQVSICVTSKCPNLGKHPTKHPDGSKIWCLKGTEEEWCMSGGAHLRPDTVYNSTLKKSVTIRCSYAEKLRLKQLTVK
jgi:hypothetical protein